MSFRQPSDYLPLFAGTEIVRRSGALTQFPVGNLLGNLPPAIGHIWHDEFTGGPGNMLDHVADVYPALTDGKYQMSNSLMFLAEGQGGYAYTSTGGEVTAETRECPVSAGQWSWLVSAAGGNGRHRFTVRRNGAVQFSMEYLMNTYPTSVINVTHPNGSVTAHPYPYDPEQRFGFTLEWDSNGAGNLQGITALAGAMSMVGPMTAAFSIPRAEIFTLTLDPR